MRSRFISHTGSALQGMEGYLQKTSQNAFKLFAGKLQNITSGRRGQLATMGLTLANLTTDKAGLNKVYQENAPVIDAYFEYVDLVAMSEKLGEEEMVTSRLSQTLVKSSVLLLAGMAIGAIGQRMLNDK